jgi:chemotaxis signal transduction protein
MTMRRRQGARRAPANKTLMFAAAGLPLGVPLEDMLRVVEAQDLLPLPLQHPALCGVMPSLEGVSPVYDLSLMGAGTGHVASGPGMVALFPHPHGSVGIRVEKLAGLADEVETVSGSLQKGLLQALPAAVQPLVTGAATHHGHLFYFFSKDAFLNWVVEEGQKVG